MRGHIVKRYKNSDTIVLNMGADPATGKRKQQWVTIKGTKKEAEKRLAELLHQLDNGTFIKPGKTTVADYLNQWLKDYCRASLAPRTAEGYESRTLPFNPLSRSNQPNSVETGAFTAYVFGEVSNRI